MNTQYCLEFRCVPPRGPAQDGASGEKSMLTPGTRRRQPPSRMAMRGKSRQMFAGSSLPHAKLVRAIEAVGTRVAPALRDISIADKAI